MLHKTEVAGGIKNLSLDQILQNNTHPQYKESLQKTLEYITQFIQKESFYSGISLHELKEKVEISSVQQSAAPVSLDEALEEIKSIYLDHTIAFHHPSYLAHLNCPILIPALAGELLASAVNTAVETWDQSTSATLIEQDIIDWTCREFHLPETADGVFTSGGTQSNLMGLLAARDHIAFSRFGINIKKNGTNETVSKFRIFCSEKAHFSILKNAAILGLGYDAVVSVKSNSRYEMDADALRNAVEAQLAEGNIPMAVVATLGTTDFGSFDPIDEINRIAKEYSMWLHADCAYGGCYFLTKTHQTLLDGVRNADSVTIDFHKTLFQPLSSGAFLMADKQLFRYISHYADYLNPVESKDEFPNLIVKSIQTTRRFDALKLWFTLKVTGKEAIGAFLEEVHFRAKDTYHLLKQKECFEVIHEPALSTVVFRYIIPGLEDDSLLNALNLNIKKSLFESGKASVASTKVNEKIYLKFTLLNPATTVEDIDYVLEMIKTQAEITLMKNQTA